MKFRFNVHASGIPCIRSQYKIFDSHAEAVQWVKDKHDDCMVELQTDNHTAIIPAVVWHHSVVTIEVIHDDE